MERAGRTDRFHRTQTLVPPAACSPRPAAPRRGIALARPLRSPRLRDDRRDSKDRDLTFVAPLGVGAHLERWGVPAAQIAELDWWDSRVFGDLTLWATPARHASGRELLVDDGATLWAGYAFIGARHRVYYSGDTGLFPGLRTIGDRLGPFDLTMIEAGQYDQTWPDWHLGPEQAVEAHRRVRGAVMLPVHWGLFALASHGWTEPIERVLAAARDCRCGGHLSPAGAERRAHRGEAPGALVARTAMAHRGARTRSSRTTETEAGSVALCGHLRKAMLQD